MQNEIHLESDQYHILRKIEISQEDLVKTKFFFPGQRCVDKMNKKLPV